MIHHRAPAAICIRILSKTSASSAPTGRRLRARVPELDALCSPAAAHSPIEDTCRRRPSPTLDASFFCRICAGHTLLTVGRLLPRRSLLSTRAMDVPSAMPVQSPRCSEVDVLRSTAAAYSLIEDACRRRASPTPDVSNFAFQILQDCVV